MKIWYQKIQKLGSAECWFWKRSNYIIILAYAGTDSSVVAFMNFVLPAGGHLFAPLICVE